MMTKAELALVLRRLEDCYDVAVNSTGMCCGGPHCWTPVNTRLYFSSQGHHPECEFVAAKAILERELNDET